MNDRRPRNRYIRVRLQTTDGVMIDVCVDWRQPKPLHLNGRVVYLQDWNATDPIVQFYMDARFEEQIGVAVEEFAKYEAASQWEVEGRIWRTILRDCKVEMHLLQSDSQTTQWQVRLEQDGNLEIKTFAGGVGIHDSFFEAQAWVEQSCL